MEAIAIVLFAWAATVSFVAFRASARAESAHERIASCQNFDLELFKRVGRLECSNIRPRAPELGFVDASTDYLSEVI